jgi:hypothetical protein
VTSTIGDRAEDTVRADAQPALVGLGDTVDILVDDVAEPLVHDLTDPLEDLVSGLDGLLGDG